MKFYYRGTNNPHEPNLLAQGRLWPSINHITGQYEAGVSVSETPASLYTKFSIVCKVTGKVLDTPGSDGEILLDAETVRLLI